MKNEGLWVVQRMNTPSLLVGIGIVVLICLLYYPLYRAIKNAVKAKTKCSICEDLVK